jgi:hypothetical protein
MNKKALLSTFWIVLTVNYIFCDVFSLMHAPDLQNFLTGQVDDITLDEQFLLSFAIIMELAMIMILLSKTLKYKLNRLLNIAIAIVLGFIQIWSVSVGQVTLHYWFFSLIEIGLCAAILLTAFRWKEAQ